MTQLGATAFEQVYAALPDARAQVRSGTDVVDRAVTSGLRLERASGELGQFDQAQITIRMLAEDELPRNPMTPGKQVDLKVGSQDWRRVRITSRKNIAGLLTLTIETLYEQ